MLDHLLAPLEALKEGLRVLKPGGLIGVRCPMGGDVYEPTEPLLIRGFELYERLREHNGSTRSLGRRLRGCLLRQVLFGWKRPPRATRMAPLKESSSGVKG